MKFNTIGIIAKPDAESVRQTMFQLLDFLKTRTCCVILDDKIPDSLNPDGLEKSDRSGIAERCDLAIAVGGDGTILNTVRSLAHANVPMIGVNVGRLGFLTDIYPDDLESALSEILDGKYHEEQRFLLEMAIKRGDEIIARGDAFNDVVVHIRDVARMMEFETRIDDIFVSHQRADGIVVSTPTGSTAYALSAGGPILHATMDAITLVPVSPHTLSSRPLVVDSASEIDIIIHQTRQGIAQASCDGHSSIDVHAGDHILIRRKQGCITMLHPAQHNYFEILRAKLHWSEYS
jgi:NAD+ kinase